MNHQFLVCLPSPWYQKTTGLPSAVKRERVWEPTGKRFPGKTDTELLFLSKIERPETVLVDVVVLED